MSIPEIIDWNLKNIFSKWAPNKTNRILFHKNNLDETKKISKNCILLMSMSRDELKSDFSARFPSLWCSIYPGLRNNFDGCAVSCFELCLTTQCVMTLCYDEFVEWKTVSSCYLSCFNQNEPIWDPNRVLPHFFDAKTAKISLIQP